MSLHNLQVEIHKHLSCDYHRLYLPYKDMDIKTKVPVFIYSRLCKAGDSMLAALKFSGYKIICDVDDYWFLDPDHYLSENYKNNGFSQRIINSIQMADIVTVTTDLLASRVMPFNKNVVVIPNALPFDTGQFTLSKDKENGTTFIYVGGVSHRHDLSLIQGMFDKVTIAGLSDHSEWQEILKKAPNATFKLEKPTDSYMDSYEGHKVALAPLIYNSFNECKSNLKVLEAGAKGLPIIASRHLPYYNQLDKNAVIWADDAYGFNKQMKGLLKSPSYIKEAGEHLAAHVRKHYSLSKANAIRRQILESFS